MDYYDTRTGTYSIATAWLTPGRALVASEPDIGLMTNGQLKTVSFQTYNDLDTVWFSATNGQVARITMGRTQATNSLRSQITLYNPSGTSVANAFSDDTATISNQLTATGTYTVRCMEYYGSRKGNYQVGLTLYPAP